MSKDADFVPLQVAVLTVSDKHKADTDSTGDWLVSALKQSGHCLNARSILPNDKYQLRALISSWIASDDIQVVLINGGTGFAAHNCTEEAVKALLDRDVTGFGELFRQLSFADIGTASMQSQAFAGLANSTILFAVPGSGGAAKLAWQKLIEPQLDARQGPCNFVSHIKSGSCND